MIASSGFLRRTLALDALACAAAGGLLASGGGALSRPLGLSAGLMQPMGLFLFGYSAVLAWMAGRESLPGAAVWAVIAANIVWTAESLLVLASGHLHPTSLGSAFIVAQAVAVAVFAELEFLGLRRSPRIAT